MGQGRDNAKEFLAQNPELATALRGQILEAAGVVPADSAEPSEDSEKGDSEDGGKQAAATSA